MTRSGLTWLLAMSTSVTLAAAFAACSSGDGASSTSTFQSTSTTSGAGGGNTGGGGLGGEDVPITALAIDPTQAKLVVDGVTPKTQAFKAIGTLGDGSKQQVAATFSVDDPAPGSIDASGLYTATGAAGGVVHVTASYGGKTATAELTIALAPNVDEGDVPPNAPALFDPNQNTAVADDPKAPSIVYPSGGTMFPSNVYKILFQWRAQGMTLFHAHFVGDLIDLSIYTDGVHATCTGAATGGGCWEATPQTWAWLASAAAGKKVTLTVESADPANPGTFYVGKSIDLFFSKDPVPGAIYYWSTTSAGIMRATVSDAAPTKFMTPTEVGQCVACHTLSRNGKRLGADVGGENLWVVDVDKNVPPPVVFDDDNGKKIASAWCTFNPDASRVVSAKSGVLTLRDGDTGAPVGANTGKIDLAGKFGTQPDWAPDGNHLAFTYGTNNKDRGVQGSSIGMLDAAGDVFSNLVLVRQSSGASDTYAYPMFDPTGQWIAYMHATGASDKNDAAQLFIAKAEQGASETQLTNADTVVADGVVPSGVANNMPTWAPTANGATTRWIAFASKRDYGLVLSAASKYGDERQQLWVAAIDPQKLGSGDPSYAAFRLPFQLLTEDNHRPFWAEDALDIPDGGVPDGGTPDAGPCVDTGGDCSSGYCCNGNTCQPNADGSAYVCVFNPPK